MSHSYAANPRLRAVAANAAVQTQQSALRAGASSVQFGASMKRKAMKKPGSTLGLAFGGMLAGLIVYNALSQGELHPSPIFTSFPGQTVELPTGALAPTPPIRPSNGIESLLATNEPDPELVKEIQNELANRGAYQGAVDGTWNKNTEIALRDFEKLAGLSATPLREISSDTAARIRESKMSTKDQMLMLIKRSNGGEIDKARSISSAQKALNKLGYGPVSEDGQYGPSSRQALEKFEKDRKLPVRGELSQRSAKELTKLSGIQVAFE